MMHLICPILNKLSMELSGKAVLLGSTVVGKTSMMLRFVKGNFP